VFAHATSVVENATTCRRCSPCPTRRASGSLFILIAWVCLVAAELLGPQSQKTRMAVAGAALAVASLLLIIAGRWGTFG
jgi:hypothetical protein